MKTVRIFFITLPALALAECDLSTFSNPEFPGFSISESYDADIQFETDNANEITKIIKQDDCFYTEYDVKARTQYYEGPGSYTSTYS